MIIRKELKMSWLKFQVARVGENYEVNRKRFIGCFSGVIVWCYKEVSEYDSAIWMIRVLGSQYQECFIDAVGHLVFDFTSNKMYEVTSIAT